MNDWDAPDTRRYRAALLDWLACAYAGRAMPTAQHAISAADGMPGRVAALATAGHVVDFDDTYLPGIAHLSAPTAPTALVVGAAAHAPVGRTLAAYAWGFEAMAAVARASHPHLYDRGWHPTAVCGVVGSAAVAGALLDLNDEQRDAAVRLALLAAGGLRAAFGSDGKSLQVGFAAAAGVTAARLAGEGATTSTAVVHEGYLAAYGGRWATPDPREPAVRANWIKRYPCCLQTHGAIEAALDLARQGADAAGRGVVRVHPLSRQAAALDDVSTGLEAKFSIPYCTALALLHGPPGLTDFAGIRPDVRDLASRITVETDSGMEESEAVVSWTQAGSDLVARVDAAIGSPEHPMSAEQLTAKVASLAGRALDGLLDDPNRHTADVLDVLSPAVAEHA